MFSNTDSSVTVECQFTVFKAGRYFPANFVPAILFQPIALSEVSLWAYFVKPLSIKLELEDMEVQTRIGGAVSHICINVTYSSFT